MSFQGGSDRNHIGFWWLLGRGSLRFGNCTRPRRRGPPAKGSCSPKSAAWDRSCSVKARESSGKCLKRFLKRSPIWGEKLRVGGQSPGRSQGGFPNGPEFTGGEMKTRFDFFLPALKRRKKKPRVLARTPRREWKI